jgi:twinfilin-like protein
LLHSVGSGSGGNIIANRFPTDIPASFLEAFADFITDKSDLALPLVLEDGQLQPLPPVHHKHPIASIQTALNDLDAVLSPRTPLYLLIRRNDSLTAITYVPYLAKEEQRAFFLEHRHDLVRQLGEEHFAQSLVCKEIGEITDARSWVERDNNATSHKNTDEHVKDPQACTEDGCIECKPKDLGYARNKCRLCDRRMKNAITPEALEALKILTNPGSLVQIVTPPPFSSTCTLTNIPSTSTPHQPSPSSTPP